MFSSFLGLILSSFFVIGGISLLIIGLLKKQRPIWLSGCLMTFISIGVICYLLYQGAVFIKEEIVDKAEVSTMVRKSGEVIGTGVGEFITGMSTGLNNSLVKAKIYPDSSIIRKGIILGRGEKEELVTQRTFSTAHTTDSSLGTETQNTITSSSREELVYVKIYMEFTKDYQGEMVLSAYDGSDTFLGESAISINQSAGTKESISFYFDQDVELGLDTYYLLNEIE